MNILLSGVGGQGILFMTRVLAEMAMRRRWSVMGSETHGMAQRGGSVVSHLKLDQDAASPLIRIGDAELLIGLEENEGLRCLGYLRPGGHLIVNRGEGKIERPTLRRYLKEQGIAAEAIAASELAGQLGYPLGVNLILLGATQGLHWLPFTVKEMERVVGKISRPGLVEPNLASLRSGFHAAAQPL